MSKPIRIQKALSDGGILSRRKTEEYIDAGRITVNGRPAKPGHAVVPNKDLIVIDGEKVVFERRKNNVYLMLHKPRGFVTTLSDEMGRKTVADLVADYPHRVYPVGRLDRDSEGLLLLTNDGAFANQVMHPSTGVGKTYRVTIKGEPTDDQLVKLQTGVDIEDGRTLPAQVHVLDKSPGRSVLQMTIFEGKNRQIRKMCEAIGLEVSRLKRTSIGPIKLGMLQPGQYRELKPSELIALRNALAKGGGPQQLQEEARPAKKATPTRSTSAKGKDYKGKGGGNYKKSAPKSAEYRRADQKKPYPKGR